MPYIDRKAGIIVAAYAQKQRHNQEFIVDDRPDIIAFLNPLPSPDPDDILDAKLDAINTSALDPATKVFADAMKAALRGNGGARGRGQK